MPAGDVVPVVPRGVADRLADQRACRAVEDRVDALGFEERAGGRLVPVGAADELGAPGHDRGVAGGQVVEDDDVVAGLEERRRTRRPT